MSSDSRAIIFRALVEAEPPWLRYQKQASYQLRHGVALIRQEMPGASFNKILVLGPGPPLDRLLEMAREFYGESAFGILVEAEAGHPVEAELQARGWRVEEDEPTLVMSTIPPAPPLPPGLLIRCVDDETSLRDLHQTTTIAFGMPPELAQELAPSLAYARDPEVAMLVGYLSGRPVATAVSFSLNAVSWVAGVCTLPEYRRRGLATALTWAALAEASRRGCQAAALNAGPESFPLYRKMGFEHVCNHRTYALPVSLPPLALQ